MKLAFVSEHAQADVQAFSGIPYYMYLHLGNVHEVTAHIHSPFPDLGELLSDPRSGWARLREIGNRLSRQLKSVDADVVLCQGSSMLPFLETEKAVILWHDSTWQTLLRIPIDQFFHTYGALAKWDQMALENCDAVVFATTWVKEETLRNYSLNRPLIGVAPFGPSLSSPTLGAVREVIEKRPVTPCQLTFVGVDWRRKGLELAHSVMGRLNRQGCPANLNVIGTNLKVGDEGQWSAAKPYSDAALLQLRIRTDRKVRVVGFVRKEIEAEGRHFQEILGSSHFLLHPAEFEPFGVALVEAGTLGVPVLTTDRFGPGEIVKDGINGRRFPPEEFVAGAAEFISGRMQNAGNYREGARLAAEYAGRRLSWSSAIDRMTGLVQSALRKT